MALIVTKEFRFEASHQLDWHKGKCCRMHGHTYTLFVSVKGEVNEHGVVMDFGDIKTMVEEKIIELLDHTHLNTIIPNPTAENIIIWIWEHLISSLPKLHKLTLMEGKYNTVCYQGEGNA